MEQSQSAGSCENASFCCRHKLGARECSKKDVKELRKIRDERNELPMQELTNLFDEKLVIYRWQQRKMLLLLVVSTA